jgi:hypothetical protein
MGPIFEQLGITMDVKELERTTMYNKCLDPKAFGAICLGPAWGKDYADGYTFGPPLFSKTALYPSCCNYSALGATPDQLKEWGYTVTSVPSVDDKMKECSAAEGDARFQCWADTDKVLMEDIVPWIPYLFDKANDIISENVINYSFDQFAGLAAYDQYAIAPDAQ